MTTTIINVLKISYRQYDNYRFNEYLNWCTKWSVQMGIPLYHMVMNKHLYNWYLTEWHNQVEKPFVAEIRSYILAKVEDPISYLNLLEIYPDTIQQIYPEQLLKQIHQNYDTKTNLRANTGKKRLSVTVRSKRSELPSYKKGNQNPSK